MHLLYVLYSLCNRVCGKSTFTLLQHPATPNEQDMHVKTKQPQLNMRLSCRHVFTVCKRTLLHIAMSLAVNHSFFEYIWASFEMDFVIFGTFWAIFLSCSLCLGPLEQFENWLSTFRLEEMKGEISELLVNSPSIRALYTKMVSFYLFIYFFAFTPELFRQTALCQAVLLTHIY